MATPTHLHVDIGMGGRALVKLEEPFSAHVGKWGWVIAMRQVVGTDTRQWWKVPGKELACVAGELKRVGRGLLGAPCSCFYPHR